MTLDDFHFASILVSTVRNAPVLIWAAMAGLFAERSGMIDIGLEGKILASAFASAAVAYTTQNPYYGMAAGMLVCVALALLQAYVSITQKGNQLVAGMAIGTLFTLFILPSVYLWLAEETKSPDRAAGMQPLPQPLPQPAPA